MMMFTALALMAAQAQGPAPAPAPAATPAPSFGQRMAAARAARRAAAAVPGTEPAPTARARPAPRAPDPERAAVMAPINAMLHALETNDGAAILANTRPEGRATVALERENGQRAVRSRSWAEFAQLLRPDGNRYVERIFAPRVMIDGDVAMVWARYVVRRNRAVDHCGYDHFDLVREGEQWKVLNVTWSQRTTGCVAVRTMGAPRARRAATPPLSAQ